MLLLHGYKASERRAAVSPADCRRQRLPAANFEECAAACLAQPWSLVPSLPRHFSPGHGDNLAHRRGLAREHHVYLRALDHDRNSIF